MSQYPNPPHLNSNALSYKLDLFIQCKDLRNMDILSKSDPLVALYRPAPLTQQNRSRSSNTKWNLVAKTEKQKDELNPSFKQSLSLDYHFEQQQPIRFVVWDIDSKDERLDKADFIGSVQFDLAELVASKGMIVKKQLLNSKRKSNGIIIIRGQQQSDVNDDVQFKISGKKLDKKDFFSSDPYLQIFTRTNHGEWVLVHETDKVKKSLNPHWTPFTMSARKLCNGDYNRPIRFTVWDWDKVGSDDLIGSVEMSVHQLLEQKKNPIAIINPNKKKKNGVAGHLVFEKLQVQRKYSFLDYIRGGCQISLVVAVDFTGSNGNPNSSNSLHYRDPRGYSRNQYEQAIHSVGDILAYYDSDKKFPCYGFGGRIPTQNGWMLSHCFALNGTAGQPECYGIDGVLNAYHQAINSVQLYGPTVFSEVIRKAADHASGYVSQDVQQYTVLLLLTDGLLNDIDQTIEQIVRASNLPLSIIIVGVGNADFTKMEVLDSDNVALRGKSGRSARRDCVQFVPFNRFKQNPQLLASQVLAELPHQVEQFFHQHKITPNAAAQVDINQVQVTMGQEDFPQQHNQNYQMFQNFQQQGRSNMQPPQQQQQQQYGAPNMPPPQQQQQYQQQQGAPNNQMYQNFQQQQARPNMPPSQQQYGAPNMAPPQQGYYQQGPPRQGGY